MAAGLRSLRLQGGKPPFAPAMGIGVPAANSAVLTGAIWKVPFVSDGTGIAEPCANNALPCGIDAIRATIWCPIGGCSGGAVVAGWVTHMPGSM